MGGDCGRSILMVGLGVSVTSPYGLMYSICIFLALFPIIKVLMSIFGNWSPRKVYMETMHVHNFTIMQTFVCIKSCKAANR